MRGRNAGLRVLSFLLAMIMVAGLLPAQIFAADNSKQTGIVATDTPMTAALEEAKTYIDTITLNNASNDPATVVGNFGTHFTWDNEKRESSKSYLFDWSYYNGVVFEGLEYVFEATGETAYGEYVVEYMQAMIDANGKWTMCSNNSSKQTAGYSSTHGADCYKTASLLLDTYAMTGDERYRTMAATLYADLDTAANTYLLANAGNNYRHTWASDSTPDLWLDGLYMILPFRAEYAKHSGDTEELDLIVSRMQWVSDNMYNEDKGLFYHAADSATSNSGTFWLRSIGWYAAAIVDIMDSMEGDNLEAMKAQLVKLVDGMKECQNATNGMWLNNMAADESSTNPYETSGTALVCYAVMKAVNKGWLDESYASMATLAFRGICNEKLEDNNLTDICFKGAPGSSNSTFYDNEGKGLGPFIMFYAEVLKYTKETSEPEAPEVTDPTEPEETDPTEPEETDPTEPEETTPSVSDQIATDGVNSFVIGGVSGTLTGAALSDEHKALLDAKGYESYVAMDVTGTVAEGETAVVSISIPAGWDTSRIVGIHMENGAVVEIPGTVSGGVFTFEVSHFSGAGIALLAETPVSKDGYLVGGKVYTLDSNGVTANKNYLIVSGNSGEVSALTNNNGSVAGTPVTVSGNTITVADDTNIAWQFSGSTSGNVGNNGRYVYPNNGSLTLADNAGNSTMTISNQNNGAYRIYRTANTYNYHLRYNNGWTGTRNRTWSGTYYNVYLYELTSSSAGEAVNFSITPSSVTLAPGGTQALTGTVIVGTETYDLSELSSGDLQWSVTQDGNYVTVENGRVTANSDGEATVTATLRSVKGTALQDPIDLSIQVKVSSAKITVSTVEGSVSDTAQVSMKTGSSQYLVPYVTVNDSPVAFGDCEFTWEVTSGAEFATVSTAGEVVANAAGTATVTGTLISADGYAPSEEMTVTYTITIENPTVTFAVTPETMTVKAGTKSALTSEILVDGVAAETSDITWESSAPNIVEVDKYGRLIARAAGEATITATLHHANGFATELADTVTVNVEAVTIGFNVTEETASIPVGAVQSLNATATVDGIIATTSEIIWVSSDENVATVDSNGKITAVGAGTATITATLTEANNATASIVDTVSVTVEAKTPASIELPESSRNGYVVKNSAPGTVVTNADGNPILIKVTYEDDTVGYVELTLEMLNETESQLAAEGTYPGLTVTYNDLTAEEKLTLNVVGTPGNNFPQYPDPGSIRVNKVLAESGQFQNTGVAEIHLSTSGVPVHVGINVILIADISNSMSWDDSTYSYADTAITAGTNQRMNLSKTSIKQFAAELLSDYTDGTKTKNTFTLLAFAGIDGDYNTHSTAAANDDVYRLGALAMQTTTAVNAAVDDMVKATTGGTNYDYAFQQAYELAQELYALNGQKVYIVFMTDGAPTHYNGVYYKSRDNTDLTALMRYKAPGSTVTNINNLPLYVSNGTDSEAAGGNDIDYTETQKVTIHYNDGTTAEKTVTYNKGWADYITQNKNEWVEAVKSLEYVEKLYSIGFGMKNGSVTQGATTSMPTPTVNGGGDYYIPASVTEAVLRRIGEDGYYEAVNAEELKTLYDSLASSIKEAATSAYFVDQMGDSFSLQMSSTLTKLGQTITLDPEPHIEISTYNIYKNADIGKKIDGVTVTEAMVGERYGKPTIIETVIFNKAGTAAYFDMNADGEPDSDVSIIENGVIVGKNFWYNTNPSATEITLPDGTKAMLDSEAFRWNIGTINDIEFVLSYYVYLDGAVEGNVPAGSYKTNNYANLYYTNWLDNSVQLPVNSPQLPWKSAQVSYAFYLVDENGNPLTNQSTEAIGSFYDAVKLTTPVLYDSVYLNSIKTVSIEPEAINVLPEGYELYDPAAKYKLTIDSSTGEESLTGWEIISGVGKKQSTYVTNFNGAIASNAPAESNVAYNYTNTVVWFAVKFQKGTVPDVIVIDYGLPVDISVMVNDMLNSSASLYSIGEYDAAWDGNSKIWKTTYDVPDASYGTTRTSKYGTAVVNGDKVRYTPANMTMNSYDRFGYIVKQQEARTGGAIVDAYYYGSVTVIPATIVYYEDSFVSYNVDAWDYGSNGWKENTDRAFDWVKEDNFNATQDEDRVGQFSLPEVDADNVYGSDGAYTNMSTHSMNGYAKVTVDYDHAAYAKFDFYGTGFDVISLTSNKTGTIIVTVYPYRSDGNYANETPERQYIVDTYYGYRRVETAEGEIIWELAPDDSDIIYQVPVMKIAGLKYGKYHAVINAAYDLLFDHNQYANEQYDFYLDAIRIYDPAGTTYDVTDNEGNVTSDGNINDVIQDAYIADGEGWPLYEELRNNVLSANSFDDVANGLLENAGNKPMTGLVFIDGDEAVGDADIADYKNYGPNNELYLAPGQDVAFMLNLDKYCSFIEKDDNGVVVKQESGTIIASVQIGVKSATGKEVSYTICNIGKAGNPYAAEGTTLTTTTDMYYNITDYRGDVIVISNTNDSADAGKILSITNIKVTFTQNPETYTSTVTPLGGTDSADAQNQTNGTVQLMSAGTDTAQEEVGLIYMTYEATQRTLQALNSRNAAEEPDVEETVPEETEPETTVPEETEPETTEPEETEPEATEPVTTEPEETEPETTEPVTTEPVETEPEATEPEKETPEVFRPWFLNVFLSSRTVREGDRIIVTVVTSSDVESLTVNGIEVERYTESGWWIKNRTWIVSLKAAAVGTMNINVVAYNSDGMPCRAATKTVEVLPKQPNPGVELPGKKHH